MTRRQWMAIAPGDVLRSPSGALRVVLAVAEPPVDKPTRRSITLRKLRPSWNAPCGFTVLFPTDDPGLVLTGRCVDVRSDMLLCSRHGELHAVRATRSL